MGNVPFFIIQKNLKQLVLDLLKIAHVYRIFSLTYSIQDISMFINSIPVLSRLGV
jgi:hypothetical protein